MAFATKALKNDKQDDQIEIAEQNGARSVGNLGQKCTETAGCDGRFEMSALLVKVEKSEEE